MRIFLVVFLALILALPSWLSHTVTTEGWGASVAYEAWLIFHVGIVFALYFSTRNIFNVWGGILLTGMYMSLFCVYTGITPQTVSLLNIGISLLAGLLAYIAATPVQLFLLKGAGRESYSILFAIIVVTAVSFFL